MILLIFSFTLNPFLKKQASKHVTTYEFIIIYQILAISLVIGFIFYLLKYKKCSLANRESVLVNDRLTKL